MTNLQVHIRLNTDGAYQLLDNHGAGVLASMDDLKPPDTECLETVIQALCQIGATLHKIEAGDEVPVWLRGSTAPAGYIFHDATTTTTPEAL